MAASNGIKPELLDALLKGRDPKTLSEPAKAQFALPFEELSMIGGQQLPQRVGRSTRHGWPHGRPFVTEYLQPV